VKRRCAGPSILCAAMMLTTRTSVTVGHRRTHVRVVHVNGRGSLLEGWYLAKVWPTEHGYRHDPPDYGPFATKREAESIKKQRLDLFSAGWLRPVLTPHQEKALLLVERYRGEATCTIVGAALTGRKSSYGHQTSAREGGRTLTALRRMHLVVDSYTEDGKHRVWKLTAVGLSVVKTVKEKRGRA